MENKLSAKEAKTHFGLLLDMAQRKPVTIEKKGRPVVVVLSLRDFSYYERLEDELLALKAMQAEKDGWLSQNESSDFLAQLGTVKTNKKSSNHVKNTDH
ncbi:MAG: type II toxin-antitoxin system Phd/YefM family antitoxin [bacterium]